MQNAKETSPGIEALQAGEQRYNDTTNADALIEAHGPEIRYVKGWGWLAYDGARWVRDAEGQVVEFAKATIRQMFWQAGQSDDRYERKELFRHANASLSYPRLRAMVELAKSDARIRADVDDFDRDPMLFNVTNGTIDLRTGELMPHDPENLITHLAGTHYDPDARSEEWEKFIGWAADKRADLAEFLQRALGYSLTGKVSEKAFYFPYGATGNNGKTTLLEAFKNVMGTYGLAVDPQTILSKSGVSGDVTRDNAALVGRRFIMATEPDEGMQFRMGRLKQLTGSDTLPARQLYQEPYDFKPVLKIWLAANNKPAMPESTDAAWSRVKLIPFDAHISDEEKDGNLPAKLREAAPAILAWAVRGCVVWQHFGLNEPACMREARQDYRAEQDSFQAFLDECCESDPPAKTQFKDVLTAYRKWRVAAEPDAPELSQKTLRQPLEGHGFKTKRVKEGWLALGLRLREDTNQPGTTSARPTGDRPASEALTEKELWVLRNRCGVSDEDLDEMTASEAKDVLRAWQAQTDRRPR